MNPPSRLLLGRAFVRACVLSLASAILSLEPLSAQGQVNEALTQEVWEMLYKVPAGSTANAAWMQQDDDGDGLKNGAELSAGTDPYKGTSTVKVTNTAINAQGEAEFSFPTMPRKRYQLQQNGNLSNPAGWTDVAGKTLLGGPNNGATEKLAVTPSANTYYRIRVSDVDSDGDQVADWTERVTGYNPDSGMTDGRTADGAAIQNAADSLNQVTITATKANATQPVNANTAPEEVGTIVISRGIAKLGSIAATAITVGLQAAGTAIPGVGTADGDYEALPSSVSFPTGVNQVVLTVNPRANGGRKSNVTAVVTALPGSGYTLGTKRTASVLINPSGAPDGTGLTGYYQNASSSVYGPTAGADQQDIYNSTPEMTRVDSTIDFMSSPTGTARAWSATGGINTGSAFSVRWIGQILPKYSETYFIDMRSDDSAKVWVNGVLLIDRWTGQGATDYSNTIELTGGVLYDIQIDYWNSSGTSEAKLYWWSLSQPKEIIPMSRLYPAVAATDKTLALTNSISATAYVNVPFSFALAAANSSAGGVTYSLDPASGPLPPGLSLNASSGVISGTPTVVGTTQVSINAINTVANTPRGSTALTITVHPSGSVTREILAADGTFSPNGTIASLDDDTDYPNNTKRRIRGYLVPPKTGNYYFWIAANNAAELYVGNDHESVNRVLRSSVVGGTGKKQWNSANVRRSPWIALKAGDRYYIEVLHDTGTDADDHLAVGWCQDDVGTIMSVANAPNPTGARTTIADGGNPLSGYQYSGTIPSYVFQPFDYPATNSGAGPLYAANLGPQGTATTKASGSAVLRLEPGPNPNSAVLRFAYQNLSTPRTAYHLHVDSYTEGNVTHPQGEIVYDIDDIDAFHPELRTPDGGYIWNFTPTGSFTSVQQIRNAISMGKVYLNVHSVTYPAGEIRGTLTLIDGSQTPPKPSDYPEPATQDVAAAKADAARFLHHAAFGVSPEDLAKVQASGFAGWIDDQLTKTPSRTANDVVANLTADINQPYPSSNFTNAWWKYAITGPDQLRQRLAFALGQILVVSWQDNTGPLQNNGRVLADYHDTLIDYCLPTPGLPESGNFRGVLKSVTLTPAMGLYLDMRGNQKADLTIGRHPNENYAREIMQLFSVGINRRWDDGRFILNGNADVVPVYTQPTILGFSALFTGWGYSQVNQANGRLPSGSTGTTDFLNAMVLVPTQHDLRSKLLLNNVVTPAATGMTPRVAISSVPVGNPCVINTSSVHGLKAGDTIRIANVTGGAFSESINNTFRVSEIVSPTAFRIPITCTTAATVSSNSTVTGPTVTAPTFTGTSLPAIAGSQADNNNFAGWTLPHPYDQYGTNELEIAMDNIMGNPNVAPYICRQLIQRFVTSDPSPGYLYRVVQKWRDNGSGVQGDLVAVMKQILLDGEARSRSLASSNVAFGKQREPMLRLTGVARTFPAASYTGTYQQLSGVNSHRLRITTSAVNDFSANFSVGLNFRDNYTATTPPNPSWNPTTTSYSVASTLGVARTSVGVSSITNPGNVCRVITSAPHGLTTGNTVRVLNISGGTFSGSITTVSRMVTRIDASTFDIQGVTCSALPTLSANSLIVSNPCVFTTVQDHGLISGDTITITGVSGGAFNPTIANASFSVTVLSANSFSIPVDCTSPATVSTGNIVGGNSFDVNATGMANASYVQAAGSNVLTVNTGGPQTEVVVPGTTIALSAIEAGNPCVVTTSAAHNLTTGDIVGITGITDGVFSSAINANFIATVIDGSKFSIPVDCTAAPPSANQGTLTKRIRSRVYLHFLSQTNVSGAAQPASQVYEVLTTPTGGSFTVRMPDTLARNGNVIVPKFGTSYTPTANLADTNSTTRSNAIVIFNTNVNHNLISGNRVWVDTPVVANPLNDGEYEVPAQEVVSNTINRGVVDEDHFRIFFKPVSENGGVYPKPSGSNNGITIYPLIPPPLGRSGVVNISQSTFNLGSTEGNLSQSPLNAPTVFNFFFPDYKFPGSLSTAGVDSPEFQLSTDTNLSNLTNSLARMLIGTGGSNSNLNGLSSFDNGNGSIVLDIGKYMTSGWTSTANVPSLVDEIAALLIGGPLEPSSRTTIISFVGNAANFPMNSPNPTGQQMRDRVRAVIHLIVTSAEYAVQK